MPTTFFIFSAIFLSWFDWRIWIRKRCFVPRWRKIEKNEERNGRDLECQPMINLLSFKCAQIEIKYLSSVRATKKTRLFQDTERFANCKYWNLLNKLLWRQTLTTCRSGTNLREHQAHRLCRPHSQTLCLWNVTEPNSFYQTHCLNNSRRWRELWKWEEHPMSLCRNLSIMYMTADWYHMRWHPSLKPNREKKNKTKQKKNEGK